MNDPTGNLAGVDNIVGAGIGFGVDLAAQYAQAKIVGKPFQINVARSGAATVAGFITSGVSSLIGENVESAGLGAATSFTLRTAGNAAVGAATNAGSTYAVNQITGSNDNLYTAALWGGWVWSAGFSCSRCYTRS